MIPVKPASTATIDEAAALLRVGKLVAFPTETVYGLGGDATNDRAVAAIYEAKGRPTFNPLIIHLPDAESAKSLVVWNDRAEKLASLFWPGPLTLILPRAAQSPISLLASAGLESLALRVPSHPVAQEMLKSAKIPVAAPSANASGSLSPTAAAHVAASLQKGVELILDGGETEVGVESTVLDLTGEIPTILRPGGVTLESLQKVLGPVAIAAPIGTDAPKSPGQLSSHYAPGIKVRLNAETAAANEAFLGFGPAMPEAGAVRLNLSPTGDLREAAANLFAMMRKLDRPELKGMAVMPIPNDGLGAAINDRLNRAAAPRD